MAWYDKLFCWGMITLFGIFIATTAKADDSHYGNFFTTQPKLEYVFDAALMADMMTTADIKNTNLVETNPILGAHPSDAKIAAYGLGAAALHAAITYEMVSNDVPRGIITAWELVSIGVETGYVAHNYKLGLRIKF
jgi:hypothetical protein